VLVGPSPGTDLALEVAGEAHRVFAVDIRTLDIEPGSRWVVAWRETEAGWPVATRLTISLATLPAETEISVFQQGFEHLPLSDCLTIWESYRRFWRKALERLSAAAGST
jgi:uncharacterized protein YndB with AHSA1/START domain